MSVFQILEELRNTSSTREKVEILEKNRDTKHLREVLYYTLNTSLTFGIKKIPYYKSFDTTLALDDVFPLLEDLISRNITGNAAKNAVLSLLAHLSPKEADVVEKIITRKLRVGVSIKTANKVFPGLIYEYPVLKGEKFTPKLASKLPLPFIVQKKYDGSRINIFRDVKGNISFKTSNGKDVDCGNAAIMDDIIKHCPANYMLDGELLALKDGKFLPREISNGLCNKAIRGTITDEERDLFRIILWDCLPITSFDKGIDDEGYADRFSKLIDIVTGMESILASESEYVYSVEEAQKMAANYIIEGGEGAMLKSTTLIWKGARSPDMLKIKNKKEVDVVVIDVIGGEGKYEGKVGALTVESADGIVFNVGSGLTDNDREQPFDYWMDKIVEVNYNGLIKNNDGSYSIFLPIFDRVRLDKQDPTNIVD